MSDIEQEAILNKQPIPVPIEGIKTILYQMENCICEIYKDNGQKASGFLCNIPFYNKTIPFLITNNHVLKDSDIRINKIIELTINNEVREIKIDRTRIRYTNKELDVTFIEIKPDKDNIYNFLEIDKDININNENIVLEYSKKSIYVLHYLEGKLSISYGLTNDIIDNKIINYYCNTEEGSSGSPILSLETYKIIGIHYGGNNKMNFGTYIKYAIEKLRKSKFEINLIYNKKDAKGNNIFGEKFVENNKNNIDLIINGKKTKLIKKYKLLDGDNNVTIVIKNKITNLEYMFYDCKSLKNIDELEILNTKDVNNFKCMFYGCSSLSNINALQNWDVSNGNNFQSMFCGCSSLTNIKAIQNWDVSNGKNFLGMFGECLHLSNIEPLQNWDVSNANNFEGMFCGCSSLLSIEALQNWDVSSGNNFEGMFYGCPSLTDIKALQNWNISKKNFDSLI